MRRPSMGLAVAVLVILCASPVESELCRGRDASPQIQIQCEQWMRSEARERRERLRDAEREQREYEAERRRREYELGRRPRALPYQPRP